MTRKNDGRGRKSEQILRVLLVVSLAAALTVALVPGAAGAQGGGPGGDRVGGVVRVDRGETVHGDFQAFAGTVVVAGTVEGNVSAVGGSVIVSGDVTGDVRTAAGSVVVSGRVGGDLRGSAGSLEVRPDATVGGTVEAAAGDLRLDGTVRGDARLAGDTVRIGPSAVVGGDVVYDASSFSVADGARIDGTVTRDDSLSVGYSPTFAGGGVPAFSVPRGVFAAWGFVVDLLLGALLVAVAPAFTGRVLEYGTTEPVRSGAYGLGTFVVVPVALVVLLITIVGIPLALVGALLYAFALWVGQVYGALVLGTWLLSLADVDSRWWGLLLGVFVLLVLAFVPFGIGSFLQLIVLLVGLGALALALWRSRGGRENVPEGPGPDVDESAVA
ncbi:MAG: polymer-forming cytoskeletal protein [Salinigranum sp.]